VRSDGVQRSRGRVSQRPHRHQLFDRRVESASLLTVCLSPQGLSCCCTVGLSRSSARTRRAAAAIRLRVGSAYESAPAYLPAALRRRSALQSSLLPRALALPTSLPTARPKMPVVVHHLENSRSTRVLFLLEELGVDYKIKTYERDPKTRLCVRVSSSKAEPAARPRRCARCTRSARLRLCSSTMGPSSPSRVRGHRPRTV